MIRAGQSRSGTARDELENGEKFDESADFGWISRGRRWEKQDPQVTHRIHGSKSTNLHQNQQITKKFGAIFGGDFRI